MPLTLGQVQPIIHECMRAGVAEKTAVESETGLYEDLEEAERLADEYWATFEPEHLTEAEIDALCTER